MAEADQVLDAVSAGRDLTLIERTVVSNIAQAGHAKMAPGEKVDAAVMRRLFLQAEKVEGGQFGRITIDGGKIAGNLDLTGLQLDFTLRLRWVELAELCLTDARVLTLELIGGSADKIVGDRLEVEHDFVASDEFRCPSVWLPAMKGGGDLNFAGAKLVGGDQGSSLLLDGARVGGRLFLGGQGKSGPVFEAARGVVMRNGRIDGGLMANKGQFGNELRLTRTQVRGEVSLRWAKVSGDLELAATRVSSDLRLDGTRVEGSNVDLARAEVGGSFTWKVTHPLKNQLDVDLTQARVRYLNDDLTAWRGAQLRMEGFSFDGVVVPDEEKWVNKRKEWLKSQSPEWSAHPYDQLRTALRNAGQESASRAIAVERETQRRKRGDLNRFWRAVNWLYGLLLGHGYRPWQFFIATAAVMVAFGLHFHGLKAPCRPGPSVTKCGDFSPPAVNAPSYRGSLYSVDAFLPIDLKQVSSWSPKQTRDVWLVAFEIALGWLFTGLLLGAVTGILRRD